MMRSCGLLLPIFSLPSPYGIGTFGEQAYEFIDYLVKSGCNIWQVLPLGATSYGDSPYQSYSAYALNHYFLDLDKLQSEGLLLKKECDFAGSDDGKIDYSSLYLHRLPILKKAFLRDRADIFAFEKLHSYWLDDFALFMALKGHFNGLSWQEWDDDIRMRTDDSIKHYSNILKDEIKFYKWLQYKLYDQWQQLKKYANDHNVSIMGDVPIYVALDSADAWANYSILQLDDERRPTLVAGVPPDAFSSTGQLWGNPVYDWAELKNTHYDWWVKRMQGASLLFDSVRVDHFRGFAGYYAIPFGDKTAQNGTWLTGGGEELIDTIIKNCDVTLIAEDLGVITPDVRKLLQHSKAPGMKVLQFAFGKGGNEYLPHSYQNNCVAYTGTHDNDTTLGWYNSQKPKVKKKIKAYVGAKNSKNIVFGLIRILIASVADTVIIPVQDVLNLDNEARINLPSTLGNNWAWRLSAKQLKLLDTDMLKNWNILYDRVSFDKSTQKGSKKVLN